MIFSHEELCFMAAGLLSNLKETQIAPDINEALNLLGTDFLSYIFTETPLSLKDNQNSSASVDSIRPTISEMEYNEKE